MRHQLGTYHLWLRNFILGLAIVDTIEKPLRIYYDNSAAVFFSKNDKYSNGAKHMELKYFAIKEEVQKQRVSIEHINIELMVADPLTKGYHQRHLKNMLKGWVLIVILDAYYVWIANVCLCYQTF